jgi:hypothetical protein
MKPQFIPITCRIGMSDYKMFLGVWNQGIDSHLEAFTKSKYNENNGRLCLDFHISELHILVRRLQELGTEQAETWANDIAELEQNGDSSEATE